MMFQKPTSLVVQCPTSWDQDTGFSFSRFAGYNAKQVLAGTVSCLPTDSGDKTHGGLATVHLRFLQITRVTKVVSTDELLLLFLVWLTLLGSMHRATSNRKANLCTGSAVREIVVQESCLFLP